jgi:DNA polymerase
MAAAKKKKTEESESVDIISLLTAPGQEGKYDAEIFIGQDLQAESCSPQEFYSQSPEPENTHYEKSEKNESIDSFQKLDELMNTNPARSTIRAEKETNLKVLSEIKPVKNDSLEKISEEISACQKCELFKTRNKTVAGMGPLNAKLVFIGEAPGADEDASGIPFVGRAGQHFDKILGAAGFKKEEIFICNILKCRPPGNRNPTLSEMNCCTPFLRRQLALIKPDIIACLGNVAVRFVVGPKTPGITRVHGEWFNSIFNIPTMAMYHPSYLIRSSSRAKGSPNWQMWQDIQQLKKRYDSL